MPAFNKKVVNSSNKYLKLEQKKGKQPSHCKVKAFLKRGGFVPKPSTN
jgi:hypothetical protein